MRKKNGFTLIELLTVISIISLLMAILMPALNRAREEGRAIRCQTNMKGLVLAWTLYAADHEDQLCGAFNYNNNYLRWGHRWDWAWAPWRADVDMGVPYGGPYTEEQRKEGIRRGALYRYNQGVDIYHCPSDKTGNLRSYSIPDCLNGVEEWWNPDNPRWKVLVQLTQIRRPVEVYVFLEENDPRGFNMDSWEKDEKGLSWKDPLTVWHSKASNIGFADGHSEKVKWSKETTDHFLRYREEQGGFTPVTPGGIKDLEYMLEHWAE